MEKVLILIKIIRIISSESYMPIVRPSLHEKLTNDEIKFSSVIARTIRLTYRKSYMVVVCPIDKNIIYRKSQLSIVRPSLHEKLQGGMNELL